MISKSQLISIPLALFLFDCQAQQLQTRVVSPFSKINTAGSVSVYYTESDTLDLSVKAKSGELENVETRVENSTLIISNKGKYTGPVVVYIKNNHLSEIHASGATEFRSTNVLKADTMNLTLTGSANVNLRIEARKIKDQQSGASHLTLSGRAEALSAEVTGASSIKAYKLNATNAHITSTGAASAKVYVSETIKANATGASDIKIKGDPREVSAEAGNSASISRIKEKSDSERGNDLDTTYYNFNRKKVIVIDGPEDDLNQKCSNQKFKHWTGFAMAVNGYANKAGGTAMEEPLAFMELDYSKSFNYQFNLFEKQFNLVSNKLKVVTGFGFDYHLYAFTNKTTLNPDTAFTWGSISSDKSISYEKNKLRCTYIQVPLLLEFNSSNIPNKSFHVAIGVVGQYLIASRTKQILRDEKDEYTKIRKDSYNLSPFAAKAHLNLGYKGWTFFGEYSLTSLFQPGKGPELYPFAAGIRLVPFS